MLKLKFLLYEILKIMSYFTVYIWVVSFSHTVNLLWENSTFLELKKMHLFPSQMKPFGILFCSPLPFPELPALPLWLTRSSRRLKRRLFQKASVTLSSPACFDGPDPCSSSTLRLLVWFHLLLFAVIVCLFLSYSWDTGIVEYD